jgi:MFS transporter, DHA1 family, tetracycline resistance protein
LTTIHPSVAPRQAALVFIFITVALDVLAMGIVIPVLPGLVAGFVGWDTVRAAEIYGVFGTIWALMQFIFSPVLGALSDRFGRRPVILLSNVGLGLDYILMALAPTLGWLFVGRLISGITSASIPAAYAYVADVTPPEKRAGSFGMVGAAFGLGFVLGPALGGILGGIDPRLPFWAAGALSLANACYGFFVLPESLPQERRALFRWAKANPVGSLTLLRSHQGLLGLSSIHFLGSLAHEVFPSVFVLYAGYRYGWDERTVGLTLASAGVFSAIVQGGLVRSFVRRFGERTTLFIGLVFGVSGFLIYGLAGSGAIFWIGIPVTSLWGLSGAATQGLMSRRVPSGEQGQLQGANGSLRGIAGLIGPGLFTFTFALFIARNEWHLPGAPFLLAGALLVLALFVAWRVTHRAKGFDADRLSSTRANAEGT